MPGRTSASRASAVLAVQGLCLVFGLAVFPVLVFS